MKKIDPSKLTAEERKFYYGFNPEMSDGEVKEGIKQLPISRDDRAALWRMVKEKSVLVGQKVVKVGHRVVEIIIMAVRAFPNTTAGLVVGLILKALLASIPYLGVILGPVIGPLIAVITVSAGFMVDVACRLEWFLQPMVPTNVRV